MVSTFRYQSAEYRPRLAYLTPTVLSSMHVVHKSKVLIEITLTSTVWGKVKFITTWNPVVGYGDSMPRILPQSIVLANG